MMKKITLFFSPVLFISTICFAQNTGNIVLNKGQKLQVASAYKVAMSQEVMGQSIEVKADLTVSNTIDANDVRDTSYSVTNTITKLKITTSAMGQDDSYDSEKKEDQNSEMGKSLGKMVNTPINVEINKSGKVINQVKKEKSAQASADMMGNMIANLFGGIDDGSGGLTIVFQPIPANAPAGYNWIDSTNKDGTITHTTYTIKEIKGKEALVDVKGDLVSDKKVQAQGMEITNKSTGTLSGDMIVDTNTGIVRQRNTTLDSKGAMEMMGQEIPVTTKVTSVITVQ